MTQKTILFDINETVLDLSSLKPLFKEAFGNDAIMPVWFSMLLHTSTVCALTQTKTDFATLAGTMLDAVSARFQHLLLEEDKSAILQGFAALAPHKDIKPALNHLRQAGYRTVALTNSSLSLVSRQITHAGLLDYFDEIISVEETGSFKPDPQVYQFAAAKINQPLPSLRLVATHDWDTHGAMSVGMKAAYIDRTNAPYHPLYLKPDVFEKDMRKIAEKIIESDTLN